MPTQVKFWTKFAQVLCVCAYVLSFGLPNATGVVINVGDGTGNTTAPEDDPGFANVGILNSGSGIYLGNRWVLTASHVGAGTIELNGIDYPNVVDQTFRLENPEGFTPSTDLLLIRLQEDPGLPALHLGCDDVSITSEILLVGGGRDRVEELSFWSREEIQGDGNDVWSLASSAADSNETGYFTKSSRTVRWGANIVTATNFEADSGSGDVFSFQADFLDSPSIGDSSQAVRGDSGGAVFQKNDGIWELVGMIHAVGLKDNQPQRTDTAIFGGNTFVAELFDYADQIRSIANFEPQPGDFDGDGQITADDIDLLYTEINIPGSNSCHFDLSGNGTVSVHDADQLLVNGGILIGDANVDGKVAFSDFLLLARSFGDTDVGWANGDFDGDDTVTFGDFILLSRSFGDSFETSNATGEGPKASAVPEPTSAYLITLGSIIALVARRKRTSGNR